MVELGRIALMIDCDNVSSRTIEPVFGELKKYGVVNVRHAYGDWTAPLLSGWVDKLQPHAIRPIQQFAYAKGKNATDSAMIIGAMDLLYSMNVDAFALMTSDSDFTPLALRIRESGYPVYGFGEMKTPQAFVNACSSFMFTEKWIKADEIKKTGPIAIQKICRNKLRADAKLVCLLRTAVEQTSKEDGWANIGTVCSHINSHSPLSSINYGYKKLRCLIKATELFDVQIRNGNSIYIKDART